MSVHDLGITPACAGTTSRYPNNTCNHEDHPRLRGNNWSISTSSSLHAGSPPLAREQPVLSLNMSVCAGITPACAGTTDPPYTFHSLRQDHPRLRGNNTERLLLLILKSGSPPLAREQRGLVIMHDKRQQGSPPLAREQQEFRLVVVVFVGITPACAGTTYTTWAEAT